MIKQLKKRFVLITTVAVTAVMLILAIIVNTANFISVNTKLNDTLRSISADGGNMPRPDDIKKPDDAVNEKKPDGQFEKEAPFSTRYFVITYTENGEITETKLDKIAAVTESDTDKYLQKALNRGAGFGYTKGYKFLVSQNSDGTYTAIFLDCYRETENLTRTALLTFLSVVFCVALVYVIACCLSRKAIEPLVRANEKQKQFITDASHELKTPITVIATSLKVLEMENGKQKWIDKAEAQTQKLTELVNSLVSLTRLDEDFSPLKFGNFDISAAAAAVVESFEDFAEVRGHKITAAICRNAQFYGDEYAVRQLMSILLDNAIKHAAGESEIHFKLEKHKGGYAVSTVNKCEGVSRDDIPKLFDRFYRADKSRSGSGFGIGLSIAKSIAKGHKGSIKAELSQDGTEITFTAFLK